VWRRDPCLGLGYGFSSFISSVNLWSAGDEQQCTATEMLLDNCKIASTGCGWCRGRSPAGAATWRPEWC